MAIQSRRDQVLAYRFLLRRRHATLLSGDPDSPEAPLRKLSTATFASIMLATLMAAGAGVLGALSPGHSASWRDPNVVIVVKETGSRFIYDPTPAPQGSPPALHQILNYTSARLLLSSSGWKTVSVSEKSLADTPRAADIGIVGAPDDLPSTGNVRGGPWTVCSLPGANAQNQPVTLTRLTIGTSGDPTDGSPLGDQGLVVQAGGGYWLVWHGHRFQIGDPAAPQNGDTPARVLTFLGWSPGQALSVSQAWLDSLSALSPLRAPHLDNGTPPGTVSVTGQKVSVGQLVRIPAQNGVAERLFVVTVKGFVQIDNLQYQLLATSTDLKPMDGTPQDVGNGQSGDASTVSSGDGQWPQTPPQLVNASAAGPSTACATTAGTDGSMTVSVAPATTGQPTCYRLPPQAPSATYLADCIAVAPGTAAVVRSRTNTGIAAAEYLVSGNGEYTAKDSLGPDPATTLKALGYAAVTPIAVPQTMLDLLPDGPALTPDAARQAVVPPPPGPAPTSASGSKS
ncbi:protein of unknown function DUF690 [Catenulispora acidiphila DSM 44928]|uniref:Type VII secretion protein EccB n=1 Tax=Catenulispora acidiphila (strain DSM 44928 / JCM 14897 / NBRC 102108 / NRRL B-24433 / ID139908) TaxID=479433 RepID=C7PYM3_CATAD|nr:type VII secretion protein EccB [Catenulispora acidiphila]ACU77345.1 protein of unknown function DUF690 [Catenulispora acidiphila DSM 44928]